MYQRSLYTVYPALSGRTGLIIYAFPGLALTFIVLDTHYHYHYHVTGRGHDSALKTSAVLLGFIPGQSYCGSHKFDSF